MNLNEIADFLNDIEDRFEVSVWEIGGIKIWPFLRIQIRTQLSLEYAGGVGTKTRSFRYITNVLTSKLKWLYSTIKDSKKNCRIKKSDIVFLSDGISFNKIDDLWFHKLCDPWSDRYLKKGLSSIRFELGHNYLINRYSPSKFIQPTIDNLIIKSLFCAKLETSDDLSAQWGDFDKFVADPYINKQIGNLLNKNTLQIRIKKVLALKQYFKKNLIIIQPRIAFVVCYYSDVAMSFILACSELNIITVDLQHGIQGNLHLAYGRWHAFPQEGYQSLPNYFAVWSKLESDAIEAWCKHIPAHNAVVCGNSFANMWKDNSNSIVKSYDKLINYHYNNRPAILVTLSPGFAYYSEIKNIWEVIKSTQFEYNWYIRLHPSMVFEMRKLEKILSEIGIINYEMQRSSSIPLYSILRNVDLHVTAQSSTVIEAHDFGIASIVTADYGFELHKELILTNKAFFAVEKEHIVMNIRNILKLRGSSTNKLLIDDSRMMEKLDEIVL